MIQWEYFYPVYEGMPKNCSADIISAVSQIDQVLASGNAAQIQFVKTLYGMGALEHDDDFARYTSALEPARLITLGSRSNAASLVLAQVFGRTLNFSKVILLSMSFVIILR
jgi:hypothetical protein